MNKLNMVLAGALSFGIIAGGAAVVSATNNAPDRPAWVTADGRTDFSKMPDNAKIPYQCWSGKTVTLEGRTIKQKEGSDAMPGSPEHKLGMAKMNELRQVPGAVRETDGGEVVTIDDNNPKVQRIMQKYEAKETPQCQ